MKIRAFLAAVIALCVGCETHPAANVNNTSVLCHTLPRIHLAGSDSRFYWFLHPTQLHFEPCNGYYDVAVRTKTKSKIVFTIVAGHGRLRDLKNGSFISSNSIVGKTFEVSLDKGHVTSIAATAN